MSKLIRISFLGLVLGAASTLIGSTAFAAELRTELSGGRCYLTKGGASQSRKDVTANAQRLVQHYPSLTFAEACGFLEDVARFQAWKKNR